MKISLLAFISLISFYKNSNLRQNTSVYYLFILVSITYLSSEM